MPITPTDTTDVRLLEDGSFRLLEDGDNRLLEMTNLLFTVGAAPLALGAGVNGQAKPPPAPENFKAVRSSDFLTVTLTWDAVPGATGYEILRGADYRAQQSVIDTVTELTYEDTVTAVSNHVYSIRAINATMGVDGIRSLARYAPKKSDVLNG